MATSRARSANRADESPSTPRDLFRARSANRTSRGSRVSFSADLAEQEFMNSEDAMVRASSGASKASRDDFHLNSTVFTRAQGSSAQQVRTKSSRGPSPSRNGFADDYAEESPEHELSPGQSDPSEGGRFSVAQRFSTFGLSPKMVAMGYSKSAIIRGGTDPRTLEFKEWAATRWGVIRKRFEADDKNKHIDGGAISRAGVTLKDWVRFLQVLGFKGDAAFIHQEICRELYSEKDEEWRQQYDTYTDSENRPVYYTSKHKNISLAQLRRFEGRLRQLDASLNPAAEGSPKDLLVKLLRQKRGTVLRAWRCDIDQREAGRVSYTDFMRRCREIGVQTQGQAAWKSLQLGKNTMDFKDLCPEEAEHVELLAQKLWSVVGGDVSKAWDFIDSSHQNRVSLQDFEEALEELSFEGDAKMIFRGLDSSGLGKLRRDDFFYIRKIAQISRQMLDESKGVVTDLISWAKREQGDSGEFLNKLGLSGNCREITVSDLSARLAALGFEGNAQEAATKVARYENGIQGGTVITLESLQGLLSGARSTHLKRSDRSEKLMLGRKVLINGAFKMKAMPTERSRKPWNDSVYNDANGNQVKPRALRTYFSPPDMQPDTDFCVPPPKAPFKSDTVVFFKNRLAGQLQDGRPAWDYSHSAGAAAEINKHLPAPTRHYFKDYSDKPVRETILQEVRSRTGNPGSQSARTLHSPRSPRMTLEQKVAVITGRGHVTFEWNTGLIRPVTDFHFMKRHYDSDRNKREDNVAKFEDPRLARQVLSDAAEIINLCLSTCRDPQPSITVIREFADNRRPHNETQRQWMEGLRKHRAELVRDELVDLGLETDLFDCKVVHGEEAILIQLHWMQKDFN